MFHARGGLTRVQAAKQRKQILSEIEREHRRKDTEALAAIRDQIKSLKQRRKEAMQSAVEACRAERILAKEHAKEMRRVALEQLREAARVEKEAAREACALRKKDIRDGTGTEVEKAQKALRTERAYQVEVRRVDKRMKKQTERSTAGERRQESDDVVRQNLPPELLPLFEKVKHKIRSTDRKSRTEVLMELAESDPGMVVEAIEDLSQRELRRLLAEEKRLAKTLRTTRPRRAAGALADVPF